MTYEAKQKHLLPNEGRGMELARLLRKELGIPEAAVWFEIRFALNELVSVKCEFFPADTSDTQPSEL
jgi:hypothetical protein